MYIYIYRHSGQVTKRSALCFLNFSRGGKGQQVWFALELLKEMSATGVRADAISYGAAMSACEKGAGLSA